MSSRGQDEEEEKKRRQWGQDNSYDDRNFEQYKDPYDNKDSYEVQEEYVDDGYVDEYGVEVEVDEEEAGAITRELMEKNYPGLGDSQSMSRKDAEQKAMKAMKSLAYLGCGQLALLSGVQGLVMGAALGGFQTVIMGASTGMMRQQGFGRFVWSQSKAQGKQFGVWLSVFTGMKCSMTFAREKNDILNVAGSGFVAGSVSTLYTRNPQMIMLNGVGSAFIVSVLHFVGFGF